MDFILRLLKKIIRVGIVSSINPNTCSARVAFPDESDKVSPELSILVRGALSNKDYWIPEPGEQVLCLFLPIGNAQGFIIGSLYSDVDQPPVTDPSKRHMLFADGTNVEYDSTTNIMRIDAKGQINIMANGPIHISTVTGDVTIDANITVNGDINTSGSISSDTGITTVGSINSNQITTTGEIVSNGGVTISGGLTASGDVVAGGVSLQNHKHTLPDNSLTSSPTGGA